jgi:hypothetical protein
MVSRKMMKRMLAAESFVADMIQQALAIGMVVTLLV